MLETMVTTVQTLMQAPTPPRDAAPLQQFPLHLDWTCSTDIFTPMLGPCAPALLLLTLNRNGELSGDRLSPAPNTTDSRRTVSWLDGTAVENGEVSTDADMPTI
jgi:hypothetical protein